MPEPHHDEDHPALEPIREEANDLTKSGRGDEPMDDEEKILAGRADANMPALLTKDVPGG